MIVASSATDILFTLRNSDLIEDVANVKIINETSKATVYNENLSVAENLYYYSVTDLDGFNLTDNENYIIEVRFNDVIEYRATIYCVDTIPKVYNTQKRINTGNEYISI